MDAKKLAEENQIWKVITGSKAYGLDTPESDTDTRGLFIAPREIVLSPFQNIEQYEDKVNDTTIYELRKFIELVCNANPNIIELLFVDNPLFKHPVMDIILAEREMFLTKRSGIRFQGTLSHS